MRHHFKLVKAFLVFTLLLCLLGYSLASYAEETVSVKSIKINEKQTVLLTGASEELATVKLTFTVSPENASWQEVKWESSNEKIATVGEDGTVKGINAGKATVTAYSTQPNSKVKAQVQITVQQAVTGIELDNEFISVPVKKKATIKAAVSPGNAANRKLTWISSDESIAKVSAQGTVTGVSAGEAVITATAMDGSEVAASCRVTVYVPVSKVTLSESKQLAMPLGLTHKITAAVAPEDATNSGLVWTSADESVATVDEEGNVKAVALGKTKITAAATDGSKASATIGVTVTQPVESIELDSAVLSIPVKKTAVIKAVVNPDKAGNKKLLWSSENENIAKVNAKGQITAVGIGTTKIKAESTDGTQISAEAEVAVVQPVTKIKIQDASISLAETMIWKTVYTVLPEEATNKEVVWSSSNEKIATVDESGRITGVAPGKCVVTVQAVDGSKVKTQVNVQVKKYDVVMRMTDESKTVDFDTTEFIDGAVIIIGSRMMGDYDETTVKFANGCVRSEANRVLIPVKPGEDTVTVTVKHNSRTLLSKKKYTVLVLPETDEEPEQESGE